MEPMGLELERYAGKEARSDWLFSCEKQHALLDFEHTGTGPRDKN